VSSGASRRPWVREWRATVTTEGQREREETENGITYPVQQVELDTDGIPLCALDFCLTSVPNLPEGVEAPGAGLSIGTEDSTQVVTEDDVHEKCTVDETRAVENVVILVFDFLF